METSRLKTCTKCLTDKELEQFPLHKSYKGGRTTWCRLCLKTRALEWFKKNPDKFKAHGRKNDARPERKHKKLAVHLKNRYGLTMEDWLAMVDAQDNRCAICNIHGSRAAKGKLFIDHDHKTGKVRGLLCDNCNKAIGLFQDCTDRITKSMVYLKKHS